MKNYHSSSKTYLNCANNLRHNSKKQKQKLIINKTTTKKIGLLFFEVPVCVFVASFVCLTLVVLICFGRTTVAISFDVQQSEETNFNYATISQHINHNNSNNSSSITSQKNATLLGERDSNSDQRVVEGRSATFKWYVEVFYGILWRKIERRSSYLQQTNTKNLFCCTPEKQNKTKKRCI